MNKIVLLIVFSTSSLFASIGFEAGIQKPFNAAGNWPAINVSLISTAPKPPFYFTSGVVLRPGQKLQTEENIDHTSEIRKTHSFFGLYAGTHIALSPAFRPGIKCGFSFKREEIFAVYDGIEQRIRYSPYEINPYIGLSIHLFVFSFILTNEGVGGGLNFSFKM